MSTNSSGHLTRRHHTAGAQASVLAQRVQAAGAMSRQAVRTSYGLLVAAEAIQRTSRGLVAHAVYDIGELSPTHGLTLCGLLAGEEASVVPEMRWPDVDDRDRCVTCAAQERTRRVL